MTRDEADRIKEGMDVEVTVSFPRNHILRAKVLKKWVTSIDFAGTWYETILQGNRDCFLLESDEHHAGFNGLPVNQYVYNYAYITRILPI